MSLTKVTYSMIKDGFYDVLDYSSLASVVPAKNQSNPSSYLFSSFLSWLLPIQTAIDDAYNAGGGTVLLPKNNVPYYIDDFIELKENVTFICEDEIILADYSSGGQSVLINSSNVKIQGLILNNSDIYSGSSGENGIGITGGKNIIVTDCIVKNCKSGNNNDGTGDGGKAIQIEDGSVENVIINNCTFSRCFMAMSTRRDGSNLSPDYGILFNNICADNCGILLFVQQSNLYDVTGLQHTIQLSNFYAVNCGTFEGSMQFSRASNVIVTNGVVVTTGGSSQQPLIRGNHNNCTFSDIHWYSNVSTMINIDPSTYAYDTSHANRNNVYNIHVLGTINYISSVSLSTPNRTLRACSGNITFEEDIGVAFFGSELRNGYSTFQVQYNNKSATINTNYNFEGSEEAYTFAQLQDGYTLAAVRSGEVTVTATGMTTSPTGILRYFNNGSSVVMMIPTITGTSNSTLMSLTGIPSELTPKNQQVCLMTITDNGIVGLGLIVFNTDGTVNLRADLNAADFTPSGTKAVDGITVSYLI